MVQAIVWLTALFYVLVYGHAEKANQEDATTSSKVVRLGDRRKKPGLPEINHKASFTLTLKTLVLIAWYWIRGHRTMQIEYTFNIDFEPTSAARLQMRKEKHS